MDEVNNFASAFRNDEMITIALEDGETEFSVQKAILCDASFYFQAALRHGFKEASEHKLYLPGCDEGVLKIFIHWHCRKRFPSFRDEILKVRDLQKRQSLADERCILLIKTWVFGDAYLMPKLGDAAMSALLDISERSKTTCNVIRQAYVLAPEDSSVRDFFVKAARHEHFHGSLSTKDLEILAQTPGFISAFMGPVKAFVATHDKARKAFSPAHLEP